MDPGPNSRTRAAGGPPVGTLELYDGRTEAAKADELVLADRAERT
jgi:hypothetical protein